METIKIDEILGRLGAAASNPNEQNRLLSGALSLIANTVNKLIDTVNAQDATIDGLVSQINEDSGVANNEFENSTIDSPEKIGTE